MRIDTSAFNSKSNIYQLGFRNNRAQITPPDYGWGDEITKRLQYLTKLNDGWDGYKAKAVSFDNASFALEILKEICDRDTPEPQIVPGVDEDLQIEWHTHSGKIELHVLGRFDVNFWTDDSAICPDDEEVHLTNDFTKVLVRLRQITEQPSDTAAAAR